MKTINCRTARIGVTKYSCKTCNHVHYIYRSCQHRFCPTCGVVDTYKWAEKTLQHLLDIKHHHVVVTLPKALRFLSKMNDNRIHNLLFSVSASIIQDWFSYKYKIKPGIISVLHTAGSDLKYHPHVHLIVSGGGLHMSSKSINKLPNAYLTRQRFLANKFKKEFITKLIASHKSKPLKTPRAWNNDDTKLESFLSKLKEKQWIVSIQKPLNNLSKIVGYVGRYTKRTCISEYKLIDFKNKIVSFNFNDYKNTPRGEKPKQSIIHKPINEFLTDLLQHVPDKRYRMVRYYGLYNTHYRKYIPKNSIQNTTENIENLEWEEFAELRKLDIQHGKQDPLLCPHCKTLMTFDEIIYPFKIYYNDS